MNVAVLVPRRADGGRRDTVWNWAKDRWALERPDWPVIEGHHEEGPFNRSAAINSAAAELEWDVAVIADSDTIVGTDQITAAVAQAVRTGQITFAYDVFCYLSRTMSDRIMRGFDGMWEPGIEWMMAGTCSSMVVVTRELFDRVGGFDEGFQDWGGEDVAFWRACETLGGGDQRIAGPAWHLWHKPARVDPDRHAANCERLSRYGEAIYDADKMQALITDLRIPA